MDNLLIELKKLIPQLPQEEQNRLSDDVLDKLHSIYPFNKFEYILSHLIAHKIISIQDYYNIRSSYLNRNKYLYIFEITAPRTFGENWAQRHLNEVVPELQRPSTLLDPGYSGEYDFWYHGIKIEVKASRAVKRGSKETLIMKALSYGSLFGFDMNFQQLKPKCCHVFVWIGVWKDRIIYWVLSNADVVNNPHYSKGQHRGNTGEGQLWIKESNIKEFTPYEVDVRNILNKIEQKYTESQQMTSL